MNSKEISFFETEWGLHVTTASNCLEDYQSCSAKLKLVMDKCHNQGKSRLLFESTRNTPIMNLFRLYQTVVNLVEDGAAGFKIAFVIPQFSGDYRSDFFELIAFNRSVNIRFFSENNKAIEWLKLKRSFSKPKIQLLPTGTFFSI